MKHLFLLALIVCSITALSQTCPVKWESFDVNISDGKSTIIWTTSEEINNNHFEVEKSFDAKSFYTVYRVHPNDERKYKVSDTVSKSCFYRIKQIDNDGNFYYEQIVENIPKKVNKKSNKKGYRGMKHKYINRH